MAAIRTTDIWNLELTMPRPESSPPKEEVNVDMPVTYEGCWFLIGTKDVRPAHVKMQRTIESNLHVFQETTLDPRIEAMIETKVVYLHETAKHEAAKG